MIEYAHNDHEDLQADTLIELAQISGNAVSPLGGPAEAKEKLLGLQLAHFGAFYRQSWRANDWTYGRLDGSVRLVKILLNPDRLQRFFNGALPAMLRIKAIALDDIVSPVLKAEVTKLWVAQKYAPRILQELAFLGNAKVAVPDALPVCTEVITLRLHFGILREEIDPLLAAIAVDRSQGADALGPSDAFVQRFAAGMDANGGRTLPFSPEQAHQALKAGLIGGESLVEEAGSDLFTRTLAHTTATVQGVLASKSAKLGPVSLFFAGLRLPVLGFYFVVRGLTRQSRTSAALHGAILAIGLALVFVQLLLQAETKPTSLPPSLVTFGWALLAYGLLFSIVSSPRIVGPLIALIAMAAGVYLVSIQLIIAVAVVFLLWLSVNYRYLAIVQWLLGMATVPMAALWTKGWNGELPPPGTLHEPVYRMALLVCLILLLATWQASTLSRAAEAGLRRMRKWFLGPKG